MTGKLDIVAFDRSDDLILALQAAAGLFADDRFGLVAAVDGDRQAAVRVTEVADVFVAWLRRPVSVSLSLVAVEEQPSASTQEAS